MHNHHIKLNDDDEVRLQALIKVHGSACEAIRQLIRSSTTAPRQKLDRPSKACDN